MSARGWGAPLGRTLGELWAAALRVNVERAIRRYMGLCLIGLHPRVFSHSLETGRFYDVNVAEDRLALLEAYSDGRSPVFMMAITNTRGRISYEDARIAAMECIKLGLVPFLGRWFSEDGLCEDVSVAFDHGTTLEFMWEVSRVHRQEEFIMVTREGWKPFSNRDLESV